MSKFKFVFIVTYGRSGSTLVQNILNSIDGYLIRGENNNVLFDLYKSYQKVVFAKQRFGQEFLEKESPWYGADLLGPEKYGRKMIHLFVNEILNPTDDYKVLGFKEIRYFEHPKEFDNFLNFMRHFFYPAAFIFNKRDPNEVKNSGWWKQQEPDKVVKLISEYDLMMDNYAKKFPDNTYIVKYNEYTKNPESLRGLYEFLGEKFDLNKIKKVLSKKLTH